MFKIPLQIFSLYIKKKLEVSDGKKKRNMSRSPVALSDAELIVSSFRIYKKKQLLYED